MTATLPRQQDGAILLGGAAVGFLLLEGLRVWLPSVLFVIGDAGSSSALTMGGFALGLLTLSVVAGDLAGRSNPRWWWVLGGLLALAAMLGLRATEGGTGQAVLSSTAVVGAGVAFAALGAGATRAADARVGLLGGFAASAGLHAALGTRDLTWRSGAGATVAALLLAILAGRAIAAASRALTTRSPAPSELADARAIGWPWLVLGPALTLALVLIAPAGRMAVALGTTGPIARVAAIGVVALLALGALIAPVLRGPGATLAGPVLVLIGAAGALDAAGGRAAASQAALALGLGLVVGALPETGAPAGGPRAGRAAGSALLTLGVLVFAYYAPYDLALPFNNRAVLLAAATATAAAALAGRQRSVPDVPGRAPLPPILILLALSVALVAPSLLELRGSATSGAVTSGDATVPDREVDELVVMLANVRMGFDEQGRFRADEVARAILDSGADVVVLNEVDRGWATTGAHDVGAVLARATGMTLIFAPAADEVWGNAVLTRLPVREVEVERLPRGRDAMARSLLVVVLGLDDGREVAILGTHLSHVDRRGDTRLPQARAVAAAAARLRDRGIPTIVAGDLNAEPGQAELLAFADLVGPTLPGGRPTFPAGRPVVQIDHVLVSGELEVRAAAVLPDRLSDHRFVRVVLGVLGGPVPGGPDEGAGAQDATEGG